jgi:hypothetical protein
LRSCILSLFIVVSHGPFPSLGLVIVCISCMKVFLPPLFSLHISLIWPWPCDPSYFGTPFLLSLFANPKGTLPPLPTPLPLSLLFGRAMMLSPHPLSLPTIWPAPHTLGPPWTPLFPSNSAQGQPPSPPDSGHGRARPGHPPAHARAVARRAATHQRPPSPREHARLLVYLPDSSRHRAPPRLSPARCRCPPRGIGRSRRPSPVPCPPPSI